MKKREVLVRPSSLPSMRGSERDGSTCIALELDDLDLEIKDLRL